jgi:FtsH-binding integral membrane protein
MHSKAMGYWISFIGIFVFTGLTAWEMQNLKYIASDPSIDANDKKKIALIGGLSLYITFINLFLSMLRVFGGRE